MPAPYDESVTIRAKLHAALIDDFGMLYGWAKKRKGYYKKNGVTIHPDEIFVSDGAKSDCGNLPDR